MSYIGPRKFINALLAMLEDIPKNLLESGEYQGQGYKIRIEPAKPSSRHWVDVEVEFEDIDEKTVKAALKKASDLADKLDKKIIELLNLKEGLIGQILSGISLTLLPALSITISRPSRRREVPPGPGKESIGIFVARAWFFVKVAINTKPLTIS